MRKSLLPLLICLVLVGCKTITEIDPITGQETEVIVADPAIAEAGGNSKVFGRALFDQMLLPFEVASVVLLVAMVGAIILVKREKSAGGVTRAWEPGTQPPPEIAEEEV